MINDDGNSFENCIDPFVMLSSCDDVVVTGTKKNV